MPDETIEQELARKLAEADWLSDEDRERMTRLLGQLREVLARLSVSPALNEAQKTRRREKLREAWLDVLETCRNVDVAESELLEKQADRANAMRNMTMAMFRRMHGVKKSIEDGTFTGTWEERETMMEMVAEFEDAKPSFLEDITAEDIRQLEDEGVL